MSTENISLLILFGLLVYCGAATFRWLLKLFGYGYPYYITLTVTKNNVKTSERFYIVDEKHFIDVITNIYDNEDE